MVNNFRIRLLFENCPHITVKGQWFLVDRDKCDTIEYLRSLLLVRFFKTLKRKPNICILLDDFVLPDDESIDIIRENDILTIKMLNGNEKIPAPEIVKKPPSVQTDSSSKHQKRQTTAAVTANTLSVESRRGRPKRGCVTVEIVPEEKPKREKLFDKRCKRFQYMRGAEFSQPLGPETPIVYIKKIPNILLEKMDFANESLLANSMNNSPKNEKIKNYSFYPDYDNDDNSNNYENVNTINFSQCAQLKTLPNIKTKVAFKIMQISKKTYLPELSEFIMGEVEEIFNDSQIVKINLTNEDQIHSQTSNDILYHSMYVDWTTLIDPRLIS